MPEFSKGKQTGGKSSAKETSKPKRAMSVNRAEHQEQPSTMRNRWLVVGQGPSRTTQDQPPFTGPSAKRLCKLIGVTMEQFHEVSRVMNINDSWVGKTKKGDVFKPKFGEATGKVLEACKPGERVLVCGLATAKACGIRKPAVLTWFEWEERNVAVIPHPSGINLWWNSSENVAKAEAFLREAWAS